MGLPKNLKNDDKKLLQAYEYIAEKTGLKKALAGLASLGDKAAVEAKIKADFKGKETQKISDVLVNGANAVMLLDKMKNKEQLDPDEMQSLKSSFDKLFDAADGDIIEDSAEVLNNTGYDALLPESDNTAVKALGDFTKACTVMPAALNEYVHKTAEADVQTFQNVNDDFLSTRFAVSSVVGMDSISSKGIMEEFKKSCDSVQLGINAINSQNKEKDAKEIKAINDFAKKAKNRMAELQPDIIKAKGLIEGRIPNPIADLQKFRHDIADVSNSASPFCYSLEETQMIAEYNKTKAEIKKAYSDASEIQKKFTDLETKKDDLNDLIRRFGEGGEEYYRKERDALDEERTRRKEELERAQEICSEHDERYSEQMDKMNKVSKERLEKINTFLRNNNLGVVQHLPNEAEIKKILTSVEKKLQAKVTSLEKKKGYNEKLYTEPEKFLNTVMKEYKQLEEVDNYEAQTKQNKQLVEKASRRLQERNEERKSFGQAAANYNKLCKLDADRRTAFDKARSSAEDSKSFVDMSGASLLKHLNSISKHLDDKKRIFHSDSKEFAELKKALNDIIQSKDMDDPDGFMLDIEPRVTEDKLKALEKAASNYIDAKNKNPSRFPSNMRIVRLNYAQQLKDLSSAYMGSSKTAETGEAAARRFLMDSDNAVKGKKLEDFDPQNTLENTINEANKAFDKKLSETGLDKSMGLTKEASHSEPVKEQIKKAPALGAEK